METSGKATIAAAIITAVGGVIAAWFVLDNPPPDPEVAEFTVGVLESESSPASIEIDIGGDEVGRIFTHQEPSETTHRMPPGRKDYTLEVNYYSPAGEEGQYDPNAPTNQYPDDPSDTQPCALDQTITGTGNISLEDGDMYRVFFDGCEIVTLNVMN